MSKKITIIIALLLSITYIVNAQEIGSTSNKYLTSSVIFNGNANYAKMITETTRGTDNNTTYAYMEGAWGIQGLPNYFFTQVFAEQKFWELPLYLHAEFRTTFIENESFDVFYLGCAYCFYTDNGFLAVEPLFRYNRFDGTGYQMSFVGGWDWRHFDLSQFIDIYGCKTSKGIPNNVYSETRLYLKITKSFEIGSVITFSYAPGESLSPGVSVGVKINL